MLAALLVSALWQSSAEPIELFRGAALKADPAVRYWDVADTTLDASAPDTNFGGDLTLRGGPTRAILIRFGDLARAVGSGRRVSTARLTLTTSGGSVPELRSVSRVLVPWGEGPMTSIVSALKGPSDPLAKLTAIPWAATWRERRGARFAWQGSGASGSADSTALTGVTSRVNNGQLIVEGLGEAVQAMEERPTQNLGFVLRFASPVEFFSSQAPKNRPALSLETAVGTPTDGPDLSVTRIERGTPEGAEVSFTAHVKNVGTAPISGFGYAWTIGERLGGTVRSDAKLEPGAEATFTIRRPVKEAPDARQTPLAFRVTPSSDDRNPANDELEVFENARFLKLRVPSGIVPQSLDDWAQGQIAAFNDLFLAQSRFSFAPEGAIRRVAIQSITRELGDADAVLLPPPSAKTGVDTRWMAELAKALGGKAPAYGTIAREKVSQWGLPVEVPASQDRFPGVLGFGDTRFDGFVPYSLPIPYEPQFSNAPTADLLEPTNLLDATTVGGLNGTGGVLPKTIIIRAVDLAGRPIANALVNLSLGTRLDGPGKGAVTSPSGTFLLPTMATGLDDLILVRLTTSGQTAFGWLKVWQLLDAASRGNRTVCIFELRFNTCDGTIDGTKNLATDRILTSSPTLNPAQLGAITDGNVQTTATLGSSPGDWVEIDLGRDRTIGELTLDVGASDFWRQFAIVGYATGESAAGQTPLLREADFAWTRLNRGSETAMTYRLPATRIRYLRLINLAGGPATLRELTIRPASLPGAG